MASIDHVRLLCRGIEAWNRQRADSYFIPDLSHIDIRNARLQRAHLQQTNFDGAIITSVDMRAADLTEARLNGVNVTRSCFSGANLTKAELKGADFKRSAFSDAILDETVSFELKIRHSDLRRARICNSVLRFAHFYNSDLTEALFEGAKIDHVVMKRVWIEDERLHELEQLGFTIELPNLPNRHEWEHWSSFEVGRRNEDFGVIVYEGRAFWIGDGRWDFFISHASRDKEVLARPLADALQRLGQRVWYDESVIAAGDDLGKVIRFGASASLFGVLVVSREFFGRRWTEAEIDALESKRLFLVLHGVEAEELASLRPALADRFYLSAGIGIEQVAAKLVQAIERPPITY